MVHDNDDFANSCFRKLDSGVVKFVDISGSLYSKTEFHEVIPYGEIYTVPPATITATPNGFKFVSTRADPYTSKLGEVMKARLAKQLQLRDQRYIDKFRKSVLQNQQWQFNPRVVKDIAKACGGQISNISVPDQSVPHAVNCADESVANDVAFDDASD